MKCPVCKKEFDEYTGRRAKKFCSDACKVKFWNAEKKVKGNNKQVITINLNPTMAKEFKSISVKEENPQIAEYEKEIAGLGTSGLAVMRKKFLLKQIQFLKSKSNGV